jgi:flagellar basal-body rod modification protein FlgD
MAAVNLNTVQGQTGTQASGSNALQGMDLNSFIQLLVAELQNQDPTQPMSNTDIVQQMSQVQSIQTTSQLNTTLQSVLLGQNVSTGSSLLGQTITGLTDGDNPQSVTGTVDSVSIVNGAAKLQVGSNTISLNNVSAITPTNYSVGG